MSQTLKSEIMLQKVLKILDNKYGYSFFENFVEYEKSKNKLFNETIKKLIKYEGTEVNKEILENCHSHIDFEASNEVRCRVVDLLQGLGQKANDEYSYEQSVRKKDIQDYIGQYIDTNPIHFKHLLTNELKRLSGENWINSISRDCILNKDTGQRFAVTDDFWFLGPHQRLTQQRTDAPTLYIPITNFKEQQTNNYQRYLEFLDVCNITDIQNLAQPCTLYDDIPYLDNAVLNVGFNTPLIKEKLTQKEHAKTCTYTPREF